MLERSSRNRLFIKLGEGRVRNGSAFFIDFNRQSSIFILIQLIDNMMMLRYSLSLNFIELQVLSLISL